MNRKPLNDDDQNSVIEDLADEAQLLRLGFQNSSSGLEDDENADGLTPTVLTPVAEPNEISDIEEWDTGSRSLTADTACIESCQDSSYSAAICKDPCPSLRP